VNDGRDDCEELKAALAAFGASPEDIRQAVSANEVLDFGVWPDNETPLSLLLAMQTQWRTAGLEGRRIGLDYNALPFVIERLGLSREETDQAFFGLQVAEKEVIRVLRDR